MSRKKDDNGPRVRAIAEVIPKPRAVTEDKPKARATAEENIKARTAATKAKIGAAAAAFAGSDDEDEEEEEDEEPRRNRVPFNPPLSEPSDSEMIAAPQAKAKAPAKAASSKSAPVKRKRFVFEKIAVPTNLILLRSSDMSEDSGSERHSKPAPKKKQKTLDSFITKEKPKPKVAPIKKPAAKKTKVFDSDEEDIESDKGFSNAKPRTPPPKRTAVKARAQTTQYVDISSDEEAKKPEDNSDGFFSSDSE